jgi:tRNA-dihydrouridine synthase B
MRAYNLDFGKGLFLAPLSGYTDWPMRVLCREYGAELAYTEMISAAGLVRNTKNTCKILERPAHDAPLIAQIFTASLEEAVQAALMIEDNGFAGIDINMGCPVKKVVSKGAGAALMTESVRALSIVESVVKSVRIPVSVKMRAGWDSESVNAVELAQAFEKAGVNTVILHPRTRADMYRGKPKWEVLSEMKQNMGVPVIASGDIRSADDLQSLSELGADAFMVGRGAIGNPWIFRELIGGPSPKLGERKEVILRHFDMLCSCYGIYRGIRRMRKFISPYVKGLHGASNFRTIACTIDDPEKLRQIIGMLEVASEHEGDTIS